MLSFFCRSRKQPPVNKQDVPFPTRQLFILALCRICEPIAFMSIFPYVFFMISSFNITTDDRQISIYAGMVTSAFAFAEFSTGVLWGRLSDVVGRKPILLTGLAGTGLSMIVFGFAPNLQVALLARALGGLLNGAVIGSGLGGCLAEPVKNYPNVFAQGTLFDTYPFLLPNLVCAGVVVFSLVVGILFLEETHEKKKHRRDYGREIGSWLLERVVSSYSRDHAYTKLDESNFEEHVALIIHDEHDEAPPEYSPQDPSLHGTSSSSLDHRRTSSSSSGSQKFPLEHELDSTTPQNSIRKAFTPQVLLHIVAYGILAFHSISIEQLMPILLSTHESDVPPTLPFKFEGGYGLPSSTIGFIMSLQGVYQLVAQMIIFPFVVRRLGPLRLFRLVAFVWCFLYLVVPYLILLPHTLRLPGLALVLMCKVTLQSLSYPSNALLLANSAPSLLVLGAINGVAASTASLCRAFGPTISGFLQAAGSSAGYAGLAWWVCGAVAVVGAIESLYMTEPPVRPDLLGPTEKHAEGSGDVGGNEDGEDLVQKEDN